MLSTHFSCSFLTWDKSPREERGERLTRPRLEHKNYAFLVVSSVRHQLWLTTWPEVESEHNYEQTKIKS